MQRCARCLLPETHETISFGSDGVCNICLQTETKKHIDWQERRRWLDELVGNVKGHGDYDCIVPYSGGKDSVFQLLFVVRELKLKPLVVRFNHLGFRPLVAKNNQSVFSQLGVDVIDCSPNPRLVKRLMRESLKRNGDFCWHCHMGIFSFALRSAIVYETPLVIFGESPAEYTAYCSFEEIATLDESLFNTIVNLGANLNEMAAAIEGDYCLRDLAPFKFPSAAALEQASVKAIWLGNYIEWDTKRNVDLIQHELGWLGQEVEGVPPEYCYEKIECRWQGIRDWCKYIKRGYGRTSHLSAIDIRNGRLAQDQAIRQIDEYDGRVPASLQFFLNDISMTEEEFYEIMSAFVDPRWSFNLDLCKSGRALDDMGEWEQLC